MDNRSSFSKNHTRKIRYTMNVILVQTHKTTHDDCGFGHILIDTKVKNKNVSRCSIRLQDSENFHQVLVACADG